MKLPLSLALAAVLTGGSILPTAAEAASKPSHREESFRVSHRHRHSRLIRVWVRPHISWRHGYRHWVPGHYEWRRVYYWA